MKPIIPKALVAAALCGAGVFGLNSPVFAQNVPPPPPRDANAEAETDAEIGPSLGPPTEDDSAKARSESDPDNVPPPPRDPNSTSDEELDRSDTGATEPLPAAEREDSQPGRRTAPERDRSRGARDSESRQDTRAGARDREGARQQPMDSEPYDRRSAEPAADARRRPALGVAFRSQGEALVIEDVAPNSPAARMGLRQGDRIVALDGRVVRDMNAFTSAVSKMPLDESVELTYLRSGRLLTQDVRFAAWDSVYAEGNGVAEPQRVYRPDFDQDQPAMPRQRDEFPEFVPVPSDPYVLPPWRFDDEWDDDD